MPELPEVETYRRLLEKKLRNKKITDVSVTPDRILFGLTSPAQIRRAFLGSRIKKCGRKGKYLWMELGKKPWPVFHLGMSGSFIVSQEIPPEAKSIKLILEFEDGTVFAFKDPRRFGRMYLLKEALNSPPLSKLGPDVLNEMPSQKDIEEIFTNRTAPIKSLLMDQSLLSGIGNWMADEILFQARIAPKRKAGSLTKSELTLLRKKIISVTKLAVSKGADSDLYPTSWLFHHRWGKKAGHVSTGEVIRHTEVGGRTTAWVPDLQN